MAPNEIQIRDDHDHLAAGGREGGGVGGGCWKSTSLQVAQAS